MSLVIDKIRRWVKGSGTAGIIPTIPVSNDHTDGSWIATDIYDREMFVNTEDLAVFIRCKNTILRVNNNQASAINTDTTSFNKNLSVADTTVQLALQTFNDANLGHTIQDNGSDKTARSKLNFIGFTVADDSGNDATKITLDLTGAVLLQGQWDANANYPDISSTTQTGYSWQVSTAGSTNLGGITSWKVGDWAVKTATGWMKDVNPSTTDDLLEGLTNKYFLSSRVLSSVLTGLSLSTNQAITATDTILQAFGYLQKQISDLSYISETITITTVLDGTKNLILCNNTADINVTLPSAVTFANKTFYIKRINTGIVNILPASGTIDGETSAEISAIYDCLLLVSNGTNWYII